MAVTEYTLPSSLVNSLGITTSVEVPLYLVIVAVPLLFVEYLKSP